MPGIEPARPALGAPCDNAFCQAVFLSPSPCYNGGVKPALWISGKQPIFRRTNWSGILTVKKSPKANTEGTKRTFPNARTAASASKNSVRKRGKR